MVVVTKDYSVHLVGLGGAGTNILEAFLRMPRVKQYIQKRGVKLTCLAFDVADHDIMSLQSIYEEFMEELKDKGLPADRVSFNARSVKFTTPQSMFDFVQKFPDYLKIEGVKDLENYKPWLTSSVEIPPLAGGVGRRRALSKAIYGLNYHSLRLLDTYYENFKESVSSSVIQSIIFVIFGIGGGSGSGMAPDFVRHLRQRIGTGYPIIGIGILPCPGDDPRAKGPSCFAAINELQMLIDAGENKIIRENFGLTYENPFTAFIMMPLAPAYKKTGSLIEAQRHFDTAVVDIILNTLKFDLAEMLDGIGSNLAYNGKSIHVMTTLRITYPVLEHISLAKLYFERLNKLRAWRQVRNEILVGSVEKGFSGIDKLIDLIRIELVSALSQIQYGKPNFDSNKLESDLQAFLYDDKSVEFDFKNLIRGFDDVISESVDEVMKPMKAIGLEAREGSPEAKFRQTIMKIIDLTRNVSKTRTFHEDLSNLLEEMHSNAVAIQNLTFREKNLLNDFEDINKFVDRFLSVLKKYNETKVFAEKLITRLSSGEIAEWKNKLTTTIQEITEIELKFILRTLSSLFQTAKADMSSIEAYHNEVVSVGKTLEERRLNCKMERKKLSLFSLTEKKNLDKLFDLLSKRRSVYLILETRTEFDSEYRKLVEEIQEATNLHYNKMSDITRDRGYYDRVAELTEDERLRIIEKILMEEEDRLTRENILNEIVDIKRFRDYLTGVIRVLQIPGTLDVESSYRTNFIWVSVSSPKGVWNQDLDAEIKATLSSYLIGSATRVIHVSHIESEDPWTIRILLIASKAALTDLEIYSEMKSLYDMGTESDKLLAHSFLLEHGILASEYKSGKQSRPGLFDLVKCPKCNTEVNLRPLKEWDLSPKTGTGPKLHVKLYEHCGSKFRITKKV